MEQIEDGITEIDGRRAEATFIWNAVNFVTAMYDDLLDGNLWQLKNSVNALISIIQRMSTLTYREILEMFPVQIRYKDGEKFFGGKDLETICQSLKRIDIINLYECGIYIYTEEDETAEYPDEIGDATDFDTEIGENIMLFISSCFNDVLGSFYSTFVGTTHWLAEEYSFTAKKMMVEQRSSRRVT